MSFDILGHLATGFGVALTPMNLVYALIGSLIGTLIGVLPGIGPVATIAMLLPTTYGLEPVSALALKFGPAEYCSLMILGLIGAVVLAHGSLLKAIGMIVLGLLLGIVGTDVNSGMARFAFGIPELTDGLGVVSVAMGLFGFAEIISNLESTEKRELVNSKVRGLWLSKEQFKRALVASLRGTGLGSFLGLLPGG